MLLLLERKHCKKDEKGDSMSKKIDYPVVLLAGGLGTRLREETEFRPKPMVPIGGKPILWHIMKLYSHFGFYRFIICLGYRGDMIKNYFLNYHLDGVDFSVNTKTGAVSELQVNDEEWQVTLVDTGPTTMTGGRVARVARYVDTDHFLLTYGDGLSDINPAHVLSFHLAHNKMVTLTGVNLPSRFGNLSIEGERVTSFVEKKKVDDEWINGGFFVCKKSFFSCLSTHESCVLEQEPLHMAASNNQLMIYKHTGFWQCMDTYREQLALNELWNKGNAPWKLWGDEKKEFTAAVKSHMAHTDDNQQEAPL